MMIDIGAYTHIEFAKCWLGGFDLACKEDNAELALENIEAAIERLTEAAALLRQYIVSTDPTANQSTQEGSDEQ
jgi:hypothetical protein